MISRACLQSAAEQDAHEPTSPAVRETNIAMVVDATSPVLKRNAVQRLVNRQAKWQPHVHLKLVMRLVDEGVFRKSHPDAASVGPSDRKGRACAGP